MEEEVSQLRSGGQVGPKTAFTLPPAAGNNVSSRVNWKTR